MIYKISNTVGFFILLMLKSLIQTQFILISKTEDIIILFENIYCFHRHCGLAPQSPSETVEN